MQSPHINDAKYNMNFNIYFTELFQIKVASALNPIAPFIIACYFS